jgi:hypothetical protein
MEDGKLRPNSRCDFVQGRELRLETRRTEKRQPGRQEKDGAQGKRKKKRELVEFSNFSFVCYLKRLASLKGT